MTNSDTRLSAGTGTLYGVGVGPGDPMLLTLRAHRVICETEVLAYIVNDDGESMARGIAAHSINAPESVKKIEIPVVMPMCNDRRLANTAYDRAAETFSGYLDRGRNVVFLCEGDPLFFGSFSYIGDRLSNEYGVEVVPGISSIHAGSAVAGRSLGRLGENIAIVSGRSSDEGIIDVLKRFDNVVIMKAGARRSRLLELIAVSNRTGDACYLEYAAHPDQFIERDITKLDDASGPYFSMFLITRSDHAGVDP